MQEFYLACVSMRLDILMGYVWFFRLKWRAIAVNAAVQTYAYPMMREVREIVQEQF